MLLLRKIAWSRFGAAERSRWCSWLATLIRPLTCIHDREISSGWSLWFLQLARLDFQSIPTGVKERQSDKSEKFGKLSWSIELWRKSSLWYFEAYSARRVVPIICKASTHNACRRRLRQVTCNRARAVLSDVTVVPEPRYSGSADERWWG